MENNIFDDINLEALGSLLQQTRKQQGITQATAAKFLGVSRTTITAIEAGQRQLKASELIRLADAYNRDVSDFVRPRPIVEPFIPQFRSSQTQTAKDEEAIARTVSHLEELCTHYYELEQISGKPLIKNYPPVYKYGRMNVDRAAEGLAISERQRLGLGSAPIPSLRDTLEQAVGLRIFYLSFESREFSGFYTFETNLGGCIALNKNHPPERCRMSLAHEYAHFLAHRFRPDVFFENQYQRKPESERFADSFAQHFLMPTSSIQNRFNAIFQAQNRFTPSDLVSLAHEYGVSFEAMTYKLVDLKLIPQGISQALKKRKFSPQAARDQLGLQKYPEPIAKLPSRYVMLTISLFNQAKISIGEVAYFLQVDLLEAREITNSEHWQLVHQQPNDEDVMVMELA